MFLDSSDCRNQQRTTAARVVGDDMILHKYTSMQSSSRDYLVGLEAVQPAQVLSTMDFIQGLDPSKLVFGGVVSHPAFRVRLADFCRHCHFFSHFLPLPITTL